MSDGLRHPNDLESHHCVVGGCARCGWTATFDLADPSGVLDMSHDCVGDCAELEAIVRDLADCDPSLNIGGYDYDEHVCITCEPEEDGQPLPETAEGVTHRGSCPTQRAREWVERNPTESTDE